MKNEIIEKILNTKIPGQKKYPKEFPKTHNYDDHKAWARGSNRHYAAEQKRIQDDINQKLLLLARQFKIPASDKNLYRRLAIRLACDSYQGFKTTKEVKPRYKKWHDATLCLLWLDVYRLKHKGYRVTITRVTRHLLKYDPWKTLMGLHKANESVNTDNEAERLRQQYYKAKTLDVVLSMEKKIRTHPDLFEEYYRTYIDVLKGARKYKHQYPDPNCMFS